MEMTELRPQARLRSMPSRRLVSVWIDVLSYANDTLLGKVTATVRSVVATEAPRTFLAT